MTFLSPSHLPHDYKYQEEIPHRVKWITSLVIYFTFASYGYSFNIFGSTQIDIAQLTQSDLPTVAIGIVFRSVAYCLSALLFGLLYSYFNRQKLLIVNVFIGAAAIVSIPFMKNMWMVNGAQFVVGIVGGAIDVGMNAWILEIWQSEVNPFMQALHFSSGIGLTIAPLLTEPFLLPEVTEGYLSPIHDGYDEHVLRFAIPFAIGSLLYGISGVTLVILHLMYPYQQVTRSIGKADSATTFMRESNVGMIVILGSLFLCFYNGIEVTSFTFLADFAVYSKLKLSKSTGAFMLSVMGGVYATCRGLAILIASVKVRSSVMLLMSLFVIGLGNGLLFCFGNTNQTMLWTSAILMGTGYSCVFPTMMSYLEERINVTNVITGCFLFSSSMCVVTNPIIIGHFIESHPMTFAYTNCVSYVVCVTILVLLMILGKVRH